MSCYVITTGKGEVYVTYASSRSVAENKFRAILPGAVIASIVEATPY